jgi:hypothetical protein
MEINQGDLLDRLAIVKLKSERIDAQIMEAELKELETALAEAKEGTDSLQIEWEDLLQLLKIINGYIWDLESDIRKGKEGELGLEEVGRRALMIRDLNNIRVWTKNLVIRISGQGYADIKKDHASE